MLPDLRLHFLRLHGCPLFPPLSNYLPIRFLGLSLLFVAHELLQRCVALSPEEGHSKYLYLGQLLSGEEAAAMLGKGIELLAAQAEEVRLFHFGREKMP